MQLGQFVDHRPSRSIVAALDHFGRYAMPSIDSTVRSSANTSTTDAPRAASSSSCGDIAPVFLFTVLYRQVAEQSAHIGERSQHHQTGNDQRLRQRPRPIGTLTHDGRGRLD